MAEPKKKASKQKIQSRGISVASAIAETGGGHGGNPYHGPDGRFTTEGVIDQFYPHSRLKPGESARPVLKQPLPPVHRWEVPGSDRDKTL